MIVICKKIDAKGIDLAFVTTIFSNDFDYSYGGFGLELYQKYIVMGLVSYKDSDCIYYLIDTNGRTNWFPALLFEILDNSIPTNWFIKINNLTGNSDISYLISFEELSNNPKFYDELTDRNESAMRTYFKRKLELEKEIKSKDEY